MTTARETLRVSMTQWTWAEFIGMSLRNPSASLSDVQSKTLDTVRSVVDEGLV
jgi:hypothetical protein